MIFINNSFILKSSKAC